MFNRNVEQNSCKNETIEKHCGDLDSMKINRENTTTNISENTKHERNDTNNSSRKDLCDNYGQLESDFDDLWNVGDWEIDKDLSFEDALMPEKLERRMQDVGESSINDSVKKNDTGKPFKEDNMESKLVISNKDNTDNSKWTGWENWGVPSIFSTASQSVSTLTNSVSQGISTVLESTKKNILDANDTTQLSQTDNETNLKECESNDSSGFKLGHLSGLVSGVSKLVESTGMKVITGGLDTLETIGKKTMEVLQEGDPGLKKKQALLKLEHKKPILSVVLKEAKEKAEMENQLLEKDFVKNINYENLLDNYQGLVHFEALEILSKQCSMKLQVLLESYPEEILIEAQETIDQVKELCELPDEAEDELISIEEIKDHLKSVYDEINVDVSYSNLIIICEEIESWLNNVQLNKCDEKELHQKAIETLAQLTAVILGLFHKTGELLLLKTHHNTADEADCLVRLTTTMTSLLEIAAAKFSEKLNVKALEESNKEYANSLITNIFYEAANSTSHVQDAFQLLVPILQLGAVGVA